MFEVKKEAGIHKENVADVNEVKRPMRIFSPNVTAATAIHVPESPRMAIAVSHSPGSQPPCTSSPSPEASVQN